jgi:hypothetical protein
MERPEAAATAIDETPTDTEETGTPVEEAAVDEGPLSPADMRAKAAVGSLTSGEFLEANLTP